MGTVKYGNYTEGGLYSEEIILRETVHYKDV